MLIECLLNDIRNSIKPAAFIDDGEEAYEALKAKQAEEKAARTAARKAAKKAGVELPEDEDNEES